MHRSLALSARRTNWLTRSPILTPQFGPRSRRLELHKLAYRYCEELTMREAGNFYHSFKYLPEEQRLAMCAIYAFCRRADDIADGDWSDRFPGNEANSTEATAYGTNLNPSRIEAPSSTRKPTSTRSPNSSFPQETLHLLRRRSLDRPRVLGPQGHGPALQHSTRRV